MPGLPVLIVLSAATAALGALGGLGGAIFLVPALVIAGVEPQIAAPLGILSAGAGSLAAAPRHLDDGVVHHRLGITLEIPASAGAIAGALLSNAVSASALNVLLAVVAGGAAVMGFRQRGLRNPPRPEFSGELAGEWPGSLSGAYRLDQGVVPYQAHRVRAGLAAMLGAGLISGLAGVGGGFVKTPLMSDLMSVPVKVAAATTTFTVGITAASALTVFWLQGRIDIDAAPAVIVGSLVGGALGAQLQAGLPPRTVRVVLSAALASIAVIMLVTG